eukprot:CAMPEP_0175299038 /NCGR_PEP_ID=MMETSP0093-20121207/60401_1 /TAXON_ID=311494 /ORGANISM="Alexandrium monilatum, Strain CCMP3105" /LENGTH=61 /DNA_ID=CAMNT_0016595179 /DNA_START=31 /DNA_END=212 /DNA_ORIENTATION=-
MFPPHIIASLRALSTPDLFCSDKQPLSMVCPTPYATRADEQAVSVSTWGPFNPRTYAILPA